MKGLSKVERDHMARVCTIIEYVTNCADWSGEPPFQARRGIPTKRSYHDKAKGKKGQSLGG